MAISDKAERWTALALLWTLFVPGVVVIGIAWWLYGMAVILLSPRRLITVEKTRYPRFLDDPCVHAPLSDPGGPPAPGRYRTGDMVFCSDNDVDSALGAFEALSRGLHALCVRFAAGVSPGPRNTRFRLVASLDRSGLSPAGSRRWFPSCLSVYMASSITKLCLAQYPNTDACHGAPPRCPSNRTTHVLLHRTDHLLLTQHLPARALTADLK